jgi:hypothetical protein
MTAGAIALKVCPRWVWISREEVKVESLVTRPWKIRTGDIAHLEFVYRTASRKQLFLQWKGGEMQIALPESITEDMLTQVLGRSVDRS